MEENGGISGSESNSEALKLSYEHTLPPSEFVTKLESQNWHMSWREGHENAIKDACYNGHIIDNLVQHIVLEERYSSLIQAHRMEEELRQFLAERVERCSIREQETDESVQDEFISRTNKFIDECLVSIRKQAVLDIERKPKRKLQEEFDPSYSKRKRHEYENKYEFGTSTVQRPWEKEWERNLSELSYQIEAEMAERFSEKRRLHQKTYDDLLPIYNRLSKCDSNFGKLQGSKFDEVRKEFDIARENLWQIKRYQRFAISARLDQLKTVESALYKLYQDKNSSSSRPEAIKYFEDVVAPAYETELEEYIGFLLLSHEELKELREASPDDARRADIARSGGTISETAAGMREEPQHGQHPLAATTVIVAVSNGHRSPVNMAWVASAELAKARPFYKPFENPEKKFVSVIETSKETFSDPEPTQP